MKTILGGIVYGGRMAGPSQKRDMTETKIHNMKEAES